MFENILEPLGIVGAIIAFTEWRFHSIKEFFQQKLELEIEKSDIIHGTMKEKLEKIEHCIERLEEKV